MGKTFNLVNLAHWFLVALFSLTAVANFILVHPAPGIFYLVVSLLYYPGTNTFLQKRLGFQIPFGLKIIIALLIIWASLGVGDLAEICGL